MRLVDRLALGWRARLPVLVQTEAAECGVACLAMIASYHGHASDVAKAVVFLCSDDAGYITGVTLPVDGGATVAMPASSFRRPPGS